MAIMLQTSDITLRFQLPEFLKFVLLWPPFSRTGVVPFIQDLTSSLKSAGIECEVPPIVYEQVGQPCPCLYSSCVGLSQSVHQARCEPPWHAFHSNALVSILMRCAS